jgi:hypothetical protein
MWGRDGRRAGDLEAEREYAGDDLECPRYPTTPPGSISRQLVAPGSFVLRQIPSGPSSPRGRSPPAQAFRPAGRDVAKADAALLLLLLLRDRVVPGALLLQPWGDG